jgi:drug/metabolite transporter (DMT)-like permease
MPPLKKRASKGLCLRIVPWKFDPMPGPARTLRTYLLLLLFVALRAFGNLALAWGTKHFPQTLSIHPAPYLEAMLDPFAALGIAMLIFSMFARMALFSVADLSFVLPVTAVGYVLATLLGKFFLEESISPDRWLGTALIFAGAALVGSTPRNTTATGEAK